MTGQICRYDIIKTQTKRNARVLKTKFFNAKGNITMKVIYTNKTIELTKAEAKSASNPTSIEYDTLKTLRKDNPNFEVVVKESSKRSTKQRNGYKGLDFDYMETYIIHHSKESDTVLMEFYKRTGRRDKTHDALPRAQAYSKVAKWFLDQYSEIKNFYKDEKIAIKN